MISKPRTRFPIMVIKSNMIFFQVQISSYNRRLLRKRRVRLMQGYLISKSKMLSFMKKSNILIGMKIRATSFSVFSFLTNHLMALILNPRRLLVRLSRILNKLKILAKLAMVQFFSKQAPMKYQVDRERSRTAFHKCLNLMVILLKSMHPLEGWTTTIMLELSSLKTQQIYISHIISANLDMLKFVNTKMLSRSLFHQRKR